MIKPFLALFDIIPGCVWAALLALVFAFGTVTSFQLAHARTEHATLVADVARAAAQSERVAREDAERVARVQSQHAITQQEKSDEQTKRDAARAARERALTADNQRLRDDILTAARGGREGQVDAATCGRDDDLAHQLGADLAEAVELQGEAEATIRKRDDEVKRLLEQITVDREAAQ